MRNANDIYEQLSRKEKLIINKKLDIMVDINTPFEISNKIADEMLQTFFPLRGSGESNVLFIESKTNIFKRLNIFENLGLSMSGLTLKKN